MFVAAISSLLPHLGVVQRKYVVDICRTQFTRFSSLSGDNLLPKVCTSMISFLIFFLSMGSPLVHSCAQVFENSMFFLFVCLFGTIP